MLRDTIYLRCLLHESSPQDSPAPQRRHTPPYISRNRFLARAGQARHPRGCSALGKLSSPDKHHWGLKMFSPWTGSSDGVTDWYGEAPCQSLNPTLRKLQTLHGLGVLRYMKTKALWFNRGTGSKPEIQCFWGLYLRFYETVDKTKTYIFLVSKIPE